MKFAVLIIAAAGMGAAATVAIPSSAIDSGAAELRTLETRMSWFKLRDLNPLRAIYDWEMREINTPRTPEELGLRHTPLTPYSNAQLHFTLDPVDIDGTGTPRRLHMEDLSASNRAAWRTPPPQ